MRRRTKFRHKRRLSAAPYGYSRQTKGKYTRIAFRKSRNRR